MMQGLMQGLVNGMNQPARQLTPEEIEQQRQNEVARQQAEAAKQQKINNYIETQARLKQEKDAQLEKEAQDSMALLATKKEDPKPDEKKSAGYQTAFKHATECISRNAGSTCSAGTAEQTHACVVDYNAGYEAGQKSVQIAMKEAFAAGEAAGKSGKLDDGASDERATGGCRTQWIESYSQGHFSGKSKSAR